MRIPDELLERVRAMVADIGYRRAAWFCRAGRRSMFRWVRGEVVPHNGSVALLTYGVARWERAREINAAHRVVVPSGTPQVVSQR